MDTVRMPDLTEFESGGGGGTQVKDGRVVNGLGVEDQSYKYCYWRKADGYITVGGYWPTARADQAEDGWEPLRQYGFFLLTNIDDAGHIWRVNTEPFRQLFERGGAKEFCVEEIVEHQWHFKPPYKGVTFPQLAGVKVSDPVRCTRCAGQRWFNTIDQLTKHEAIMHADEAGNKALARNLAEANAPSTEALTQALNLLAEKQAKSDKILELLISRLMADEEQSEPLKVKSK